MSRSIEELCEIRKFVNLFVHTADLDFTHLSIFDNTNRLMLKRKIDNFMPAYIALMFTDINAIWCSIPKSAVSNSSAMILSHWMKSQLWGL